MMDDLFSEMKYQHEICQHLLFALCMIVNDHMSHVYLDVAA